MERWKIFSFKYIISKTDSMEKYTKWVYTKSSYLYKIQNYSNRKDISDSFIMGRQKKSITTQQVVV